jgi:hypothetical protein
MRKILNNRRPNETYTLQHGSFSYTVTIGYFENGQPGEIFVSSNKAGSEADITASDAAVAVSLALQYGCPIDVLRTALKRNADGSPMGPLAHALDLVR